MRIAATGATLREWPPRPTPHAHKHCDALIHCLPPECAYSWFWTTKISRGRSRGRCTGDDAEQRQAVIREAVILPERYAAGWSNHEPATIWYFGDSYSLWT